MFDKIIVHIDYKKLTIEIITEAYSRSIQCPTIESFLEEVKRDLNDINEYNKSIKGGLKYENKNIQL